MRAIARLLLLLCALPLAALADPVNINTADAATLDRELKGIGPARASAIVAYRAAHGPFKHIDELTLVDGIGQKVIDDNRELLRADRAGRPVAAPSAAAKSGTIKKAPAPPPAR